MFSVDAEIARQKLKDWARINRGDVDDQVPTRVSRGEFNQIYKLFERIEGIGEGQGLPFAIISVVIEESKPELITGAGRVQVSTPHLLNQEELSFWDNQG